MLRFASILSVLLLAFLAAPRVESASSKTEAVSTATEIRLIDPGWWPSPRGGTLKGLAIGICKVSNQNCVSCHMPKYMIPSMHTKFTDHRIAVHGNQFTE